MKKLSLNHIVQLHVLAIKQGGGSDGLRDLGRLESVVSTQSQEVFGEILYKTIFEKAAAIARGIIGDHPFIDGNKRTAVLSAITLLEINDQRFNAKKGELEDFAVKIATDKLDVAAIAVWLESKCL